MPRIAATVAEHEKVIESLPFPEDFKTCSKCGEVFLRDADHFMRKSRAADGFANHCKACDRLMRQQKKR